MTTALHVRDLRSGRATLDRKGRVQHGDAARVSRLQSKRTRSGQAAEAIVEAMHRAMASAVYMRKLPVETRMAGGKRVFIKGGVDYVGAMDGGSAVFVEVKRVTTKRFRFSMIRASQWRELDAASRMHALAIVLCIVGDSRDVCAVPFRTIIAKRMDGAVSMSRDELNVWRVKGPNYLERWTR